MPAKDEAAAKRAQRARETPSQREARLAAARTYRAGRRRLDPEGERAANASAQRAWRAANPEKRRAAHAAYRERNREKFRRYWRERRARRRGAACADPTAQREYVEIVLADPCAYCGVESETVDHIVSLAEGGSDEWDNLTGACTSCNARKWKTPLLLALIGASRT